MTAASSAVISRWVLPSVERPPATPGTAATCAPKAPKRTFASERFIARPMRIVSRVPEAPTSVPPMMSAVLSRTKPVEAAARPVKAFRSEMTTGMSAPPIGRTSREPKASAPARSSTIQTPASVAPATAPKKEEHVHDVVPGEDDRAAGHELWQLAEGDEAAREGDRADERREEHGADRVAGEVAREGRDAVVLGGGDQRRRPAADAVEERHHLRHRRHLHLAG